MLRRIRTAIYGLQGQAYLAMLITISLFTASSVFAQEAPSQRVQLRIPTVKQEISGMCGPATIEMLLRYWGIRKYDQYDIAYNLLAQFPDEKRVRKAGINLSGEIDWRRYPGTGTRMMRELLSKFAEVENFKLRSLPNDPSKRLKARDELFAKLLSYLERKIPVIVHQYWNSKGTRGHYRLVTGYDPVRKQIFLNDSRKGPITQTYGEFLELWNVDEEWLHYNGIAFNINAEPKIDVQLTRYARTR